MTLATIALATLALMAPPKDGPRIKREAKIAKEPSRAKTKPAKTKLACDAPIAGIAVALDEGLELLTRESKDKEKGTAERGVAAFQTWAKTAAPIIAGHRAEAATLDATLSDDDKKECDARAYKRIYKSLTRLISLGVFYRGHREVYRTLGDLFR